MGDQNINANTLNQSDCVGIDCDAGRKMGCQTFCCRLLVRLDHDERMVGSDDMASSRFIEKSADGYCVNLDRETYRCRIWEGRPRACRGYDCNSDFLLQVAVRHEFKNITELVKISTTAYIPKETHIQIPSSSG